MNEEEQAIYDKIKQEGTVSDLVGNINRKIKLLSDRLENIRLEYPKTGMNDGEFAVRIFRELENLHSQLSSLLQDSSSD